jgi:hypothetical protein
MTDYQDSRISIVLVVILMVLELSLLVYGLKAANLVLAVVLIAVTCFVFLLFFSLSVHVSRDAVVLSYGIGLFRTVVSLQDIQRMEIVGNTSLQSIYDTRREHVLKLHLRSGRAVIVAVGDAKRMMEVISAFNRGQ